MKIGAFTITILLCVGAPLMASGSARAGQSFASCSVVDVASFNNRVHIHCTKVSGGCDFTPGGCKQADTTPPTYVAVEASSAMAPTVIQIGLSALTMKRFVDIFYDDNAAANPAGCNANDCRRLIGVVAH